MSEHAFTDPVLGTIVLHTNARARRLTFRVKDGQLLATLPPGTTVAEVNKAVAQLRPRLQALLERAPRPPRIDLDYRIDAPCFRLCLTPGNSGRFLLRRHPDGVQIICPPDTDFSNPALQSWLYSSVEQLMRQQAKAVLPARLDELARRHGLAYTGVAITRSRSRWGSCSSRRHISLSCYLVLLPSHLADYVLLHELAHTREMNHGPRFKALLLQLTDGKAPALEQELHACRTGLPAGTGDCSRRNQTSQTTTP